MLPQRHQGHIYLHVLGEPPELTILLALTMLGVAGYVGIAGRGIRYRCTGAVGDG